ncbi:MAG: phosphoribosylanthranilate isomerase [Gammaproteobacteria bacterium]|jgi:phosphoribosylanthranilate isomerase|nr:phosphoribosylanthranilate isomerase [Gammaproteobacteria bacterium]
MPDAHARTRVKICGITRPQDALAAAALGVDAIGLVFWPSSPRAVSAAQAREVVASLPPFVSTVGLFVNATQNELEAVLDQVPLDLLQFHGDESPEFCRSARRPYLKAVRMRPGVDLDRLVGAYADAAGLLVDAYVAGMPGGTGETFDWDALPSVSGVPLVLAGGLAPGNVADAIRRVGPWAVDVSGGVESAKGIKDAVKMAAFMQGVKDGDRERGTQRGA